MAFVLGLGAFSGLGTGELLPLKSDIHPHNQGSGTLQIAQERGCPALAPDSLPT